MTDKDLQNHWTRPTQLGHEFETPIVQELPEEMRHPEHERHYSTSTQSDATPTDTGPDDGSAGASDAPPDRG
jgi:hypothetical protein